MNTANFPATLVIVPAATIIGGSNYFRSSEVAPTVTTNNEIRIIDGYGTRRYWGTPSVRTSVEALTDNVIMIDLVGWHKHTGAGPVKGTYYFVNENGHWTRRTASHKAVKAALAA